MKRLEEYKAEIFARSARRIAKRKSLCCRVLAVCIPLCLILGIGSVSVLSPKSVGPTESGSTAPESDEIRYPVPMATEVADPESGIGTYGQTEDSFSFFISWGEKGENAYESTTGRLIKDGETVSAHVITESERETIRKEVKKADLSGYPRVYDPKAKKDDRYTTLKLTVRIDGEEKTVETVSVPACFESGDPAGQKYLNLCKYLISFVTHTREWQNG